MARKRRDRDVPGPDNRKQQHLTRRDRERRKTLLGITIPLLAVAGAIIVFGAWRELVQVPSTPVAEVAGERITSGTFSTRMQYERRLLMNQLSNLMGLMQSSDPSFIQQFVGNQRTSIPQTTQDKLIDEAIIRQEAAKRGLTVTEADVDQQIYGELATALAPPATSVPELTPTPVITATETLSGTLAAPTATVAATQTPTAGPTAVPLSTAEIGRQFERRVQPMLDQLEMSIGQYREVVRQQVYRDKLTKDLADAIPATERQVDLRYLLFKDKETADAAAAALEAGTPWSEVLTRFGPTPTPAPDAVATPTLEPTAAPTAALGGTAAPPPTPTPEPNAFEQGEGGWFTRNKLVKDWALAEADADTLLGLAKNSFSQALSGGRGHYVVWVVDAQADRPVDEAELTTRKESALDDWLKAAKDEITKADKIKKFPLPNVPEPAWFVAAFNQMLATPVATSGLTVGTALPNPDGVQVMTVVAPPPAGTAAPAGP